MATATDLLFSFLENITEPKKWPTKIRRTFLMTAPISVPLWSALLMFLLFLGMLITVVGTIYIWIWEMWTGQDARNLTPMRETFEDDE